LTSLPTGGNFQVYVRDLSGATPVTQMVSVNSSGTAGGNGYSLDEVEFGPANHFTADGRYVAFLSQATDLVPGFVDGNGNGSNGNNGYDLYIRDLQTGTTVLATYNISGTASANVGAATGEGGHSGSYVLTANGPTVVFDSPARDLFNGDRNAFGDLF